jgi:hypothetical protein
MEGAGESGERMEGERRNGDKLDGAKEKNKTWPDTGTRGSIT